MLEPIDNQFEADCYKIETKIEGSSTRSLDLNQESLENQEMLWFTSTVKEPSLN